jgi:hypothetical protein
MLIAIVSLRSLEMNRQMITELPADLLAQAVPPRTPANATDASFGPALADDLIWGVTAIAREINRNNRQTFHLLENRRVPASKIGGRWCASRAGLRNFFANGGER